jgi:hypothetical protein
MTETARELVDRMNAYFADRLEPSEMGGAVSREPLDELLARLIHGAQHGFDDPSPHTVADVWASQLELSRSTIKSLRERGYLIVQVPEEWRK